MLLAVVGLLAASQIIEARVAIEATTNGASVEMEYLVAAPANGLTFDAIKWPGQTISLEGSAALTVRDLGGLLRIEPMETGPETFRLVYTVTGNRERVPLFVPNLPTIPGTTTTTISVSGVAAGASLADAFPRVSRQSDGTLLGQPANMPSFVLLPIEGRINRARLADSLVLVMLLAASVVWIVWRVRSAT